MTGLTVRDLVATRVVYCSDYVVVGLMSGVVDVVIEVLVISVVSRESCPCRTVSCSFPVAYIVCCRRCRVTRTRRHNTCDAAPVADGNIDESWRA